MKTLKSTLKRVEYTYETEWGVVKILTENDKFIEASVPFLKDKLSRAQWTCVQDIATEIDHLCGSDKSKIPEITEAEVEQWEVVHTAKTEVTQ